MFPLFICFCQLKKIMESTKLLILVTWVVALSDILIFISIAKIFKSILTSLIGKKFTNTVMVLLFCELGSLTIGTFSGLMLKLQFFGHLKQRAKLVGKDPDAGKDWRQEEKGTTENEMVGWLHRLNGQESEQTLEESQGQESLACCSPWGHKESDVTLRLNMNNFQKTGTVGNK